MLDLSADDVLATTRSVRKRLDLERPVDRAIIEECIDLALQAPTGSNRQAWQWVVVDDPDLKRGVADQYRPVWEAYNDAPRPSYDQSDPRADALPRVISSAQYLAEHMHEVPAMVIPCFHGRAEQLTTTVEQAGQWGSILPAAWSFILALRARGLGSAWTTLHLQNERATAELLGIPFDTWTQAGLFPLAYTKGTEFKRASRLPAAELIHWNRW